MLDPLTIDTANAPIVAFATSERPAVRHWTELGIWFVPSADGRMFLAKNSGCSSVQGQTTRSRAVYVGTIERALEHFDEGDLFDALRIQALDWQDRNPTLAQDTLLQLRAEENKAAGRNGAPKGYVGDGTLIDALRWLYDPVREQLVSDNNLVDRFSEDFGIPSRTVRESLKNQREGKDLPSWARVFVGSLMHFDRGAFIAMAGRA